MELVALIKIAADEEPVEERSRTLGENVLVIWSGSKPSAKTSRNTNYAKICARKSIHLQLCLLKRLLIPSVMRLRSRGEQMSTLEGP